MSRNRRITDPSECTTPHEAQQFSNAATRQAVEYDCYGSKSTYKASVLIAPVPIDSARANAFYGTPPGESADSVSRFQFRARILEGDVPSPHSLLPDPCALNSATSTERVLNVISEHTLFLSEAGYNGPIPQVGDIVEVQLEPGDIKQNLQVGTFLKIVNSSVIEPVALLAREACANLTAIFDRFDEGDSGTLNELEQVETGEGFTEATDPRAPGGQMLQVAADSEEQIGLVSGIVESHVDDAIWDVSAIIRRLKSEYQWWRGWRSTGTEPHKVFYYPDAASQNPPPPEKNWPFKCQTSATHRAAHWPFESDQREGLVTHLCHWAEPKKADGATDYVDGPDNDDNILCQRLNKYWNYASAAPTGRGLSGEGDYRGPECRSNLGTGHARLGHTTAKCKNICAAQHWSAAFISYCMIKPTWRTFAAADTSGRGFVGSSSHTYYTIYAKQNREARTPTSYWMFVLDKEKVKVELGDVVVGPRTGAGAKYHSSHGDIVAKIEGNKAYCYGGNLSNSVNANVKTIELNSDGTFKRVNGTDDKYNVILKFIGPVGSTSYASATNGVVDPLAEAAGGQIYERANAVVAYLAANTDPETRHRDDQLRQYVATGVLPENPEGT